MADPMISISMARDGYPHRFPQGIYVDGELQSKMGFDMPETCSVNIDTLEDGIYNVRISQDHETPEPAVMVLYRVLLSENAPIPMFRGLIVGAKDEAARERAYRTYNERKKFL